MVQPDVPRNFLGLFTFFRGFLANGDAKQRSHYCTRKKKRYHFLQALGAPKNPSQISEQLRADAKGCALLNGAIRLEKSLRNSEIFFALRQGGRKI